MRPWIRSFEAIALILSFGVADAKAWPGSKLRPKDLSIISTRSKLDMLEHVRATVEPPCHFLYRFLVENVRHCEAAKLSRLWDCIAQEKGEDGKVCMAKACDAVPWCWSVWIVANNLCEVFVKSLCLLSWDNDNCHFAASPSWICLQGQQSEGPYCLWSRCVADITPAPFSHLSGNMADVRMGIAKSVVALCWM